MRPQLLEMSGFRSHLETTEISFEGRSLTAIVGPTGAGKSSILEAIAYALYGKTPREQRSLKRLICSRCDAARVELRFLVDDREFKVLRVLRRSGAGQHILEDLSSGEKITGDTQVTSRVVELLGLPFDAFSSSVLLAQGEFAKFLQATPSERGVILKGIFRLDQIDELHAAAKVRRDALEGDLRLIEGERNALPPDAEEILKRARTTEKTASARAGALEKAIPEEKGLLQRLGEGERRLAESLRSRDRLGDLSNRLPAGETLSELATEEERLEGARKAAEEKSKGAVERHAAAVAALENLEKELGSEGDLREARSEVAGRDAAAARLGDLRTQGKQETKARKAAAAAVAAASKELAKARSRLEALRAEQATLHREHAAHELRSGLTPGQPCPVCEQMVKVVPKGELPAELGEIAARVGDAATREQEAVRAERQAELDLGRIENSQQATATTIAALEKELEERTERLVSVFGPGGISLEDIETRLLRLSQAERSLAETRQAADLARAEWDQSKEATRSFERACLDHRQELTQLFAQLELEVPPMEGSAASLIRDTATLQSVLAERSEEVARVIKSVDSEVAGTRDQLKALRDRLSLDADDAIETAFADASAQAEVARNEAATAEKQLARLKELTKEEKKAKHRRDLFAVLASELTAQQFIAFLLEERTRLLLELGSERLHTMTSSRYRLELDDRNQLDVIDEFDADKRRSVDTLSGGETFLASLALAIALAEVVTREGGRLQCFFLDEGFGSLDPESFDLAMDGIERIVTGGRLIGLVSHVPALRDRIEDQIVLEKSDDGMSRIAAGASR